MNKNLYLRLAEEAISEWAIKRMKFKSLKYNQHLNFFLQYHHYLNRLINPKPRIVSFSSCFKVPSNLSNGFEILKNDIIRGEDLEPYLSRSIRILKKSDPFQDVFGLTHLHFYKKGQEHHTEIAMVHVSDNEIFFIEVKPHIDQSFQTPWNSKSSLEIVHKERPDLISKLKFPYLETKNFPTQLHDSSIDLLRKRGHTFFVVLDDGTQYAMPFGGQVTSAPKVKLECKKDYRTFAIKDYDLYIKLRNQIAECIDLWINDKQSSNDVEIIELRILNLEMINDRVLKSFDLRLKYRLGNSICELTQPFLVPYFRH